MLSKTRVTTHILGSNLFGLLTALGGVGAPTPSRDEREHVFWKVLKV